MGSNHTETLLIARRYATAIFAQALDAKSESEICQEFSTLAAAIGESDDLRKALQNPLVSRGQKASVLAALIKSASPLTRQSVEVVAQSGRGELLPTIARLLDEQLSAHRGALAATVTSARPLNAVTVKQVKDALKRATGKSAEITFAQDETLLGGLVIQLGSLRLDASLSGALNTMRAELSAPATT